MSKLKINDPVNVNIIENGYWKDSVRGKIVGETAKFWIIEGGSRHFYDSDKGYVPRRFSKSGGNVSYRIVK